MLEKSEKYKLNSFFISPGAINVLQFGKYAIILVFYFEVYEEAGGYNS